MPGYATIAESAPRALYDAASDLAAFRAPLYSVAKALGLATPASPVNAVSDADAAVLNGIASAIGWTQATLWTAQNVADQIQPLTQQLTLMDGVLKAEAKKSRTTDLLWLGGAAVAGFVLGRLL